MGTDTHLKFHCLLTIRDHYKGIPYGGISRGDKGTNYGFKQLKGTQNPGASIPEAQDDPALATAINEFNSASTMFFTVGCEKALNQHGDQYWKKGYLEFAFNDVDLCSDSRYYFVLFQAFSEHLHKTKFGSPLMFEWELEGAHFLDANMGGWTVAVWITTAAVATADEAQKLWALGLETLAAVMKHESFPTRKPMYEVSRS